jgi:predicted SprT family Zn-dependent metalloprotease
MKILIEQYTKQDIQNIFSNMFDEFLKYGDDLDFCTWSIVKPQVSWLRSNATRALGTCKKVGTDIQDGRIMPIFEIYLNPLMLEYEDINEKFIKDTIAHEFCHSLPGCFNHGPKFHEKAKLIYDLMGYHIDTKADIESSTYFNKILKSAPSPYKVICDNCGAETSFNRLTDKLKKSYQYQCSHCGKPYLVTYKLNKKTGEYKELDNREFIDAVREIYGIPPLQ